MEIKEEFNKIKQLLTQSKYQEAFDEVQKLDEVVKQPDDHLMFLNLKSEVLYRLGNLKKALNLTQHVLNESEKQANQLRAIDSLILRSTIFWRLGQYTDSIEAIDKGETILNRMKDTNTQIIMKKRARFLYRRSTIYSSMGDYNLSFKYAKESLTMREKIGNKEDIANSLNSVASFYFVRGDFDQALSHYKRSINLFEEINDVEAIGMILGNIGMLYLFKGELNEALNYNQRIIALLGEYGNNLFLAQGFAGVGYVYLHQGKLNEALESLQKSLNICEELDAKESIALNLGIIGSAYTGKGELTKALENLQRSLEICDEIGVSTGPYVGWYLNFIGRIYFVKGDYKLALDHYEKALAIFEELGNPVAIVSILITLVKINIELKAIEKAKDYVDQIKSINEKKHYRSVDQIYRVTQAIFYKASDRAIQRAEAQKILQQVATEELSSFELAVEVFLNLSELLLDELKSTGSEEALKEIKNYSNHLLKLSKTQNSYYLLSETYLLQSKLALLEFDVKGSQKLLSQAELIAEEKGLGKLASKIEKEKESSSALVEKVEKLIDTKPSINEIIELTKLEDLFDQMLKKRIYRKEEEVLEYAVQARALVQTMGKG